MFARERVELEYRIIRTCFENPLVKEVKFHKIEGVTFEEARQADHQALDFKRSADLYYSILQNSPSVSDKVHVFGGLALQLINACRFKDARKLLNGDLYFQLRLGIPGSERHFLEADVREKEGRLEFSERGYFQARECFSDVIKILQEKGKQRWDLSDKLAISTSHHFLGKICNELALRGIDIEQNLQLAPQYLWQAIDMDAVIRKEGTEETLGYDYLELARTYLTAGDFIKSDRFVEEARKHFEVYVQTTPKSNVLEKYLRLKGKINSLRPKNRFDRG